MTPLRAAGSTLDRFAGRHQDPDAGLDPVAARRVEHQAGQHLYRAPGP